MLRRLSRTPSKPSVEQIADGNPALLAAIARSRKMLNRRALVAAAAGAIPIPGLDWAAEAALLSKVIPQINAEFGLSPAQLDQLSPEKRESVQKAVTLVGTVLIGKLITREMLLRLTKAVGVRLTAAQAAAPSNRGPCGSSAQVPVLKGPPGDGASRAKTSETHP